MNHPEREEWITFLFGESSAQRSRELETHLSECGHCRGRVERWHRTRALLDTAQPPLAPSTPLAPRKPSGAWAWSRWAAAAALLVASFLLGQQTGVDRRDLQKALNDLRHELRTEVRAAREAEWEAIAPQIIEWIAHLEGRRMAELSQAIQTARVTDRAELLRILGEMERRHSGELARLETRLTRLVDHTGIGFEQTQAQMRLLAANLVGEQRINKEPTP